MEDLFEEFASYVSLGCEALAVLCVAIGAVRAVWLAAPALMPGRPPHTYKAAWITFAVWLMLSLEFALAADIADTVIAPDWTEIGQLAAIAAIRTVLNLFLERDLEVARGAGEAEVG